MNPQSWQNQFAEIDTNLFCDLLKNNHPIEGVRKNNFRKKTNWLLLSMLSKWNVYQL